MRRLGNETTEHRVWGMQRPGHEGRIQTLEKTIAAGSGLPAAIAHSANPVGSVGPGVGHPPWTGFFTNSAIISNGPSGLSFQVSESGFYQLHMHVTMVSQPTTITGPAIGQFTGTDAASASVGLGVGSCFYLETTSIVELQGFTYFDLDSTWTYPVQLAQSIQFGGTANVQSLWGVCVRMGDAAV